jgi:hypothetical protein
VSKVPKTHRLKELGYFLIAAGILFILRGLGIGSDTLIFWITEVLVVCLVLWAGAFGIMFYQRHRSGTPLFPSWSTTKWYRKANNVLDTTKPWRCSSCGHELTSWDTIPIFSSLYYKGKCRYCKGRIEPSILIAESLGLVAGVLVAILGKDYIWTFVNWVTSFRLH